MIDVPPIKNFDLTFMTITQALEKFRKGINHDQLEEFLGVLLNTYYSEQKVFIYSVGRSLLVGKAFAMRLMHLGFESYVIGEVVTPAVDANDIFVVISKNLTNTRISGVVNRAKKSKAKIVIITSNEDASLLNKADNLFFIPDLSEQIKIPGVYIPLGTLFEITIMVVLDSVIAELMARLEITEEAMQIRHANIE